jgi:rhamnose transport system permease protein
MAVDAPATTSRGGAVGRALGAIGRSRELTLVALMVVLGTFVTTQAPHFLSASNLTQVTTLAAIIAIASVGEAVVIITKNVDLSVESMIGLVAFVVADILRMQALPMPAAWAVGILIGLGLGMVNGTIIAFFRVPSIVATLGTLSIFRGLVFFIAGGKEVNLADLPPGYSDPASQTVLGIPVFVIVGFVIVVVMATVMRYTRFGRRTYAVGSNAEAATILGIRSRLHVFAALSICGLLAGVAGILWGMEFGTIYATSASGVSLQIIAGAVVGGVSIAGGAGTVVGAALGALFLALVNNALLVLLLPQELLQAIYGLVILIAVSADAVIQRRQRRQAAREYAL